MGHMVRSLPALRESSNARLSLLPIVWGMMMMIGELLCDDQAALNIMMFHLTRILF
jgi:hypothetical protein